MSSADKRLDVPVLFLIFNQPEITQRVFEAIRKAKPKQLFVAADGPRDNKPGEAEECEQTRKVATQVDWDCEVHTNFREKNLGCRVAVSSAITWFFNNVNEGVILEYDCLPAPSFFWFCQELLAKHRDNNQIMQINGNFHLHGLTSNTDSYYFSKLNGCWGWATWKRAWRHFESPLKEYEEQRNKIPEYYENPEISDWMISYLDEANLPDCGIWSTQWAYAILRNNGLCVNPTVNLVNNIGFENNPTSGVHKSFLIYNKFPLEDIKEIIHPHEIVYNVQNDILEFDTVIKMSDPRLIYKGYKYHWYRLHLRFIRLMKEMMKKLNPWGHIRHVN